MKKTLKYYGFHPKKKRRTLGKMSKTCKQKLDVLESSFDEVPAELILHFAFLCSCCGQSVNTKECDEMSSSHFCRHDWDSEIEFDLGKQVCHDCSVACLHCGENPICKECYEYWGDSCDGYYPAGFEWRVHDEFVCYECEEKYVDQSDRYRMTCKICDAEAGKCQICSSSEDLLTHRKFAALNLCKECHNAFQ